MKHRIHTKGLSLGIVTGIAVGALSVVGSINSSTTAFVGIDPNFARTGDPINQNIDINDENHKKRDLIKGWPRIQDRLQEQGSYYWRNGRGKNSIPKHCWELSHASLAKCVVEAREGNIYRKQQTPRN
ncbi:MAG: hypothetical protein QF741_01670 [Candidatus Peribacteraceae bacterium]|jgi:hypothetical protein|nr:hypothetical protein [Candidatus Peribacteraceae bacterium]MDP7454768.1 hypothetical protein [Candidatus Peribacteraceae bacterium]MDP7645777.1 hypothetical protein [Candidatus Peribacteraceae bacterium]|tara:strand:- start:13 stop:396 length:384 start_codon:yes stop_codon:yes gene_type:complete